MAKESTPQGKRPEKEKEAEKNDAVKKCYPSQMPPGEKVCYEPPPMDAKSGAKLKMAERGRSISKKKVKKVTASPAAGASPERKHSKEKKASMHKRKSKSRSQKKIRTSPVGVPHRRTSSHHSDRIVIINVEKMQVIQQPARDSGQPVPVQANRGPKSAELKNGPMPSGTNVQSGKDDRPASPPPPSPPPAN